MFHWVQQTELHLWPSATQRTTNNSKQNATEKTVHLVEIKQMLTLTIGMFGVWWRILKLFPRPNGTRKAAIVILKLLYALQH